MKLLFDGSNLHGVYGCARRRWTLELTTDGRFTFVHGVRGCLVPADRHGAWALEGDTVVLQPEASDHLVLDVPFIPVRWGHLQLLVPEHDVPAFCADVRGGSPPSEELAFEITGGQGKFLGATGSGLFRDVVDFNRRQLTRTVEGVIAVPGAK
jgi:hypothetical protein